MQQVDLRGNVWDLGIEDHYAQTHTYTTTCERKPISLKWRPIEEYNNEEYDWVLVKYYDGDYECIPRVAERRADGKWYTDSNDDVAIPFDVKYFFDMQLIGDADDRG